MSLQLWAHTYGGNLGKLNQSSAFLVYFLIPAETVKVRGFINILMYRMTVREYCEIIAMTYVRRVQPPVCVDCLL